MNIELIREKTGFICDMDGVIYHGNHLLNGVSDFVNWLKSENKKFLFLTNSSERSPKELEQKLKRLGLDVDESHFWQVNVPEEVLLLLARQDLLMHCTMQDFP